MPLEIRTFLAIAKRGKILLSVASTENGRIILEIAQAGEDANAIPYCKNGGYRDRQKM